MSLFIGIAIVVFIAHAFLKRAPKADPTLGGRLVSRSSEQTQSIIDAHRAQHYAVVNGAWSVNWGPHMTVEEPRAHAQARREAARKRASMKALMMYWPKDVPQPVIT